MSMYKLQDMVNFVTERIWESFSDSAADILRQVQVLTVSKMKDNLTAPSHDLSMRSGNLARDVQGKIKTTTWGMESLGGVSGSRSVEAKRDMELPYAYLLTEGNWLLNERQKAKMRFLSLDTRRKAGHKTPLSELYANMGSPNTGSRIFGRPLIERSMEEVDWIKVVKENIKNRVSNKVEVVNLG